MAGPILTCSEIRTCEQRAVAAGDTMSGLMLKAGTACADVLQARHPSGRVVVLAGPGNNGGDAFVAARLLAERGRDVVLYEIAAPQRTAEGAEASAAWNRPRQPLADLKLADTDIVLDGLFGAGLSRALEGEAAEAVSRVNGSLAKVVAIDVPSGVAGDTGRAAGPALQARDTVTFGAKKPAHVLQPAARLCGEVHVAEIGFGSHIEEVSAGRLRENGPNLWAHALVWPDVEGHKYKRGRLIVVTGPAISTGAARLAARAGQRAGAGAVRVLCPPDALTIVASSMMSPLTGVFANTKDLVEQAEAGSAVVIGPAAGVNDATRDNVEALAKAKLKLVLDADALTVFAGDARKLKGLLKADAVLTPHTGEFERLFPKLLEKSTSKIEAAREAAEKTDGVVVLKGSDTVIAAPDGRVVVNTHATPFLATAGSGDILAGVIGGLLAQGLDGFTAACAGVWMHGDAGLRAGPGLIAEDLEATLRQTVAALYAARPGA